MLASIDAEVATRVPASLMIDVLAPETVRVCRHCGIGAPEAAAMNEPWCPGRGFHSYVDTPVSQPLPDLLETGEGR